MRLAVGHATRTHYNKVSLWLGLLVLISAYMSVFERSKHLYVSPDFDKIIKDTIRFFNQTPVHTLPV